jgi:hypothetical protein
MRALADVAQEHPAEDDWIHPLDAAARREPLARGGVRVIVMATADTPDPDAIGQGLLDLLARRKREADAFVVRADAVGWARALEQGLADGMHPIVLVTSAAAPWTAGHLDPLLSAIDARDHVVGRRPLSLGGRLRRWLATRPWRLLFALPVADVYSPCLMHRRSALEAIVPQSASRFLTVEILAKATFLTQVIEEVAVPALAAVPAKTSWHDVRAVLKSPTFVREPATAVAAPSLPTEDLQGQGEGADGVGSQDSQGDHHDLAGPAGPFEHDRPQGVEELREG